MNKVTPFAFGQFQVRTVLIGNEPYFVGKDAALAIGYTQSSFRNALRSHVKNRYKRECQINTPFGMQTMTVISEPGVYQLASQSKLPSAEPFQDWVYEKVLPSIRREGAYVTPQTAADWLNNPDVMIDVLQRYKQEIKENQRLHDLNQKMKPKAEYTDTMLANPGLESTSMIAKNYGYSAVGFNRLLHELGIQYKQGQTWLLYSQYQNKGYTHIEVYGYQYGNSRKQIKNVMKWTQRGVKFLYDFLKYNDILPMVEQLSFGELREGGKTK